MRRILGLSALFYILTHFTLYVVDSRLDLAFVATEIVKRIYLLIGFTALLGLVALGVTSTDGMVKRLGAIRWNRLHKLVYVITALGILHYYMQSKVDVSQPVLMTGFFFWLMGYRLMAARRLQGRPRPAPRPVGRGGTPDRRSRRPPGTGSPPASAAGVRSSPTSTSASRSARPGGCSPRAWP